MSIFQTLKAMSNKLTKPLMAWVDKQTAKGLTGGFVSNTKNILMILAVVAVLIAVVGLIAATFVLAISIPGLLFGTILWVAWTWAGLGAELFPQLDPRWLTLNWQQFFWLTIVVYYAGKALGIRRGKAPAKS